MPLPPAPTKPADRLPPKAFAATPRAAKRARAQAEVTQVPDEVIPAPRADGKPAKEVQRKLPAVLLSPVAVTPDVVMAAAAAPVPDRTPARARKAARSGPTKLFVLDTNVLLHDPMSLFRFEEHDIYLPMIVLEELDGHKKGMTEVARNARQTSRTLDALAGTPGADITAGFQLASTGHRDARGKLLFQTQPLNYALPTSLPQGKADNQILGVVEALRQAMAPREVVLVSKDINMRVKARAY